MPEQKMVDDEPASTPYSAHRTLDYQVPEKLLPKGYRRIDHSRKPAFKMGIATPWIAFLVTAAITLISRGELTKASLSACAVAAGTYGIYQYIEHKHLRYFAGLAAGFLIFIAIVLLIFLCICGLFSMSK